MGFTFGEKQKSFRVDLFLSLSLAGFFLIAIFVFSFGKMKNFNNVITFNSMERITIDLLEDWQQASLADKENISHFKIIKKNNTIDSLSEVMLLNRKNRKNKKEIYRTVSSFKDMDKHSYYYGILNKKDSWGEGFHFQLKYSKDTKNVEYLLVWSKGKNLITDTEIDARKKPLEFFEDDLGVLWSNKKISYLVNKNKK